MKKIERNSLKYVVIQSLAVMIAGIILYPLFDFLLCKYITNSEFVYSVYDHIVEPVAFGFMIGIILYVAENGIKMK